MANHTEKAPEKECESDSFYLRDHVCFDRNDKMVLMMFSYALSVASDLSICFIAFAEEEYLLRVDEISVRMEAMGGKLMIAEPRNGGRVYKKVKCDQNINYSALLM